MMPSFKSSPILKHRASELRKETTDAESKLWSQIRDHQLGNVHFRRQHAIGSYIVDFHSIRPKLVIEVDGGQHLEQEEYDDERTRFLESRGYKVLRFWNDEVLKDIETVLGVILDAIEVEEQS